MRYFPVNSEKKKKLDNPLPKYFFFALSTYILVCAAKAQPREIRKSA